MNGAATMPHIVREEFKPHTARYKGPFAPQRPFPKDRNTLFP